MRRYKRRFQDFVMQSQYESLVGEGVHWKRAEKRVLKAHREYGLDV